MRRPHLPGLLLMLGLLGAAALVLWSLPGDGDRPERRHGWEDTLAGMDGNPSLLMAFLAERTVVHDGAWDYRSMSEPARHLWATLRYEFDRVGGGPENPTWEEVSAAYRAIGAEGIAGRLALVVAVSTATAAQAAIAACARALPEERPRIVAARRAYVLAHREELEAE